MNSEEFLTFESEIARLQEKSGMHIPSSTSGPVQFFNDLNTWMFQGENTELDGSVFVLPNPALNLSLPYPIDEITQAVSLGSENYPHIDDIYAFAEGFALNNELLERPTSALSGGEQMLVSLCKASALSSLANSIFACSPFYWLDSKNRGLVAKTFSDYSPDSAFLFYLKGESDTESTIHSSETDFQNKPLNWFINLSNPQIRFSQQSFPRKTSAKRITYKSSSARIELQSPTLIRGKNGVGKTTLAKTLAGVLTPIQGSMELVCGGRSGRARLVTQDCVIQLFGQSVLENIDRVLRWDSAKRKEAHKFFETIQNKCFGIVSNSLPGTSLGKSDSPNSLLQCKIGLVSERLVGGFPLLILDEPGWCLSRDVARAFLFSVVEIAHSQNTAVALISHQRGWWDDLVSCTLDLLPNKDTDDVDLFVSSAGEC